MSSDNKPTITPTQDGPYLVKGLQILTNQKQSIEAKATMALCRCGASANKPFCDGEHKKMGFTSAKLDDRAEDKRDSYKGQKITIHDNRSICAHAGVCTDNLASVFRMQQEPWIDADGASVDEIIAIIRKCPSGALSYTIDEIEDNDPSVESAIFVAPNGPYVVSGECALVDAGWGEGASETSYTLCRCGASKNKPFCDGAHWSIKFTDDKN